MTDSDPVQTLEAKLRIEAADRWLTHGLAGDIDLLLAITAAQTLLDAATTWALPD